MKIVDLLGWKSAKKDDTRAEVVPHCHDSKVNCSILMTEL